MYNRAVEPVKGPVERAEPIGEVVYLQMGSAWKEIPPHPAPDWRKLELYSNKGSTLITVWRSLIQRISFQAVDWD
jgi:hypothetical protein